MDLSLIHLAVLKGDKEETSHEYLLWSEAAATDRSSSSRRYVWGNFSPCWVTQESVCTYYEYEYSAHWAIWPQKISQNVHTVFPQIVFAETILFWE